jgi:nucleolar protein 12
VTPKEAPKKRKVVSFDKDLDINTPKKRLRRDTQKGSQYRGPIVYGTRSADRKSLKRKPKEREIEHGTESGDVPDSDSELENVYASKITASKPTSDLAQTDGGDDPLPLHESLARSTRQRTKETKRRHIPEDETPEMRDGRTIFVGNLPLEILSKNVRISFVYAEIP